MSRVFKVNITSGTSQGPYSVYYDTVSPSNFATLQSTGLNAINIPYSTLATIDGVDVSVPDSSSTIILYNELCNIQKSYIIPAITTTTTTTQFSCLPPTIDSITLIGGTLLYVNFTSTNNCNNIRIEYSKDQVNWTISDGSCVSPRAITSTDGNGTWYFRAKQSCSNIESVYSNTISYTFPTISTTTTTTTVAPITYYSIALYYSDNLDVLCGNLAIENLFYIDTPSWDFASAIYTTDGITPAPAGYYTETPGLRRQWDGSILGPEVSCPIIDTGGGGCFVAGTEITLSDNTIKVIEDLKIGDQLASYNIEGLPLYSDDQNVLNTWNTSNIQGDYATATVTNIKPFNTDKIININGLLQTTPNHRHLVKVGDMWSFVEAKDIKVGDILRNYNNEEVVVETVSEEIGDFTAYVLDVEDVDLFYGNGILTHNAKLPTEP